jgi:hypothetical protein
VGAQHPEMTITYGPMIDPGGSLLLDPVHSR